MTAIEATPGSIGDLGHEAFRRELATSGVRTRIGPFAARIVARAASLDKPLYRLYEDYPLLPEDTVFSFHVSLTELRNLPRFRRVVRFLVDGKAPHEDMPAEQALPVLEWGLNLVIALRSHFYLMLHSAAVERGGGAMLLPASPGEGKSTLCAALAHRDWRLLSDEFGLIRPGTTDMTAIPRPIALKNESIDVMRAFAPDAHIGPSIPNTRKGTVAHVKPPSDSVQRQSVLAPTRWIVFPRWIEGAPVSLQRLPKAEAFMTLATNAFNYELIGEDAFRTVRDLIDSCDCYAIVYSDLEDVVNCLTDIADGHGPA